MSDREIVTAFADARRTQIPLLALPGPVPPNADRAFRLQLAVTKELGWTQIGWKIACTSERAQKALAAPGPFAGPMFENRRFKPGDQVPTHPLNRRCVEPEVAFTMARSLPPRGAHYSVDEVLGAVASVHPAIEIVHPRTPNGFADSVTWFIVDGAVDDAIILGEARKLLPREAYATLKADVTWNGRAMGSGTGANALGGGDLALAWLANHLNEKGLGLKEGDIISTGVITEFFFANLGDAVEMNLEHLGRVTIRF